jgi:UMF1 family MFS transporter
LIFFNITYTTFLLVGIFGGAFLGGLWTVTRPLLVSLAPKEKISELFGYQGLTEKFGGIVGPLAFGTVASLWGFRQALLVIIALFTLSAITLKLVKIKT